VQVGEVDHEVRDDRAAQIAGGRRHRAERQPHAERPRGPHQVAALGPDVERGEQHRLRDQPEPRAQRAAEQQLLADRAGHREQQDLAGRDVAQHRAEVAVHRARPRGARDRHPAGEHHGQRQREAEHERRAQPPGRAALVEAVDVGVAAAGRDQHRQDRHPAVQTEDHGRPAVRRFALAEHRPVTMQQGAARWRGAQAPLPMTHCKKALVRPVRPA
jgi:hypothetical protein